MEKESNFKKKLSKEAYHVLREKGTERPFTSELLKEKGNGMFVCGECGNEIFSSKTKFDSGTGWPSFYDAKKGAVEFKEDNSLFMKRTEVICSKCKGHLGHAFDDAINTPTGKRYCVNSCALDFKVSRLKGGKK